MRVLGIETSSTRGSLAVLEGTELRAVRVHEEPHRHAELTLSLIGEVLAEAGIDKRELSRIAVGVGPGSFTGVRVALALGQGIAHGLGIPLVGVGSLAAMA